MTISLADLESYASDGGYQNDTNLSNTSVVLILMLLNYASDMTNWEGYNIPLSDSDIDTIDEIIGTLSFEVME